MDASQRLTAALFAGGIATFSELYTTQAVLPDLSAEWGLTESTAALSVSVATGALAFSVLPWATVADRVGRARAMRVSALITGVVGLLLPAAPSFPALLILRGISGLALGALPALAIAHLIDQDRTGRAAAVGGIYIAGTTIGGLTGRVVTGMVGGIWGWRWGVGATGVLVAAAATSFALLLPRAGSGVSGVTHRRIRAALSTRRVWVFYLQGFLLMGGFVTMYNLLGFRLVAEPYRIPSSIVSLLFLTYLVGTVGSSAVGRLIGRWGRRPVLIAAGLGVAVGALVSLARPLPLIIAGLVIVTLCFFIAHALAVGWAGESLPRARSQATAVYSWFYYAGSSIIGYLGAVISTRAGWTGAALLIAGLAVTATAIAWLGAREQPQPHPAR